jgi:hypothetical protein
MNIHEQNVLAFGRQLDQALEPKSIVIPDYHTLRPRLGAATRHVGALDGSDQQLFAYIAHQDFGVGIWGTLYCEINVRSPGEETYRDGPVSAGVWSEDELFMYHLTLALPDAPTTLRWRNDLYAIRQILSNTRVTEPPLFSRQPERVAARAEAARERATGEWLALHSAVVHQLAPGDLLLKDGRLNCQMEMSSSWVDQLGRHAARNGVRLVGIVKAGLFYQAMYPIVQAIAARTTEAFWFLAPGEFITQAYHNEKYPERKTLMLGGRDERDLAGIGGLWAVLCPDASNFRTFVIVEFNLYDLFHYCALAREPRSLREWQAQLDGVDAGRLVPKVEVPMVHINVGVDVGQLIEPTLAEILWLCEQEVGHFGYPNLLGTAHRDVVLTNRKVEQIRKRFRSILADSDRILSELVAQDVFETPHKLHNIDP